MARLILGTAQFGTAYGETNAVGRLSDDDIAAVLAAAQLGGIRELDSSPYYGDAQSRIGRIAPNSFSVISKFGLPDTGPATAEVLVSATLSALRAETLSGLMFHRVGDLRDDRAAQTWGQLRRLRDSGIVARIGASLYDAEDLEALLKFAPDVDLIQIPGNVIDRRLLEDSRVAELRRAGCEVHVRSAYLQGLVLLDPEILPPKHRELAPAVARIHRYAADAGTDAVGVALGFLKHHPEVDAVVVGALDAMQLMATVQGWAQAPKVEPPAFTISDVAIDPRHWSRKGSN